MARAKEEVDEAGEAGDIYYAKRPGHGRVARQAQALIGLARETDTLLVR